MIINIGDVILKSIYSKSSDYTSYKQESKWIYVGKYGEKCLYLPYAAFSSKSNIVYENIVKFKSSITKLNSDTYVRELYKYEIIDNVNIRAYILKVSVQNEQINIKKRASQKTNIYINVKDINFVDTEVELVEK